MPGLPNDHYHAFADPMVFALVGIGAAAAVGAWRERRADRPHGAGGRTALGASRRSDAGCRATAADRHGAGRAAGVAVVALVGWNLLNQPPAVAADGGFPAAEAAAQRILAGRRQPTVALRSLPSFKPADAYGYPLVRAGRPVGADESATQTLVILCDDLFEAAIGAPCGGPAEDASLAAKPFQPPFALESSVPFEAAPGRWVTVYNVH